MDVLADECVTQAASTHMSPNTESKAQACTNGKAPGLHPVQMDDYNWKVEGSLVAPQTTKKKTLPHAYIGFPYHPAIFCPGLLLPKASSAGSINLPLFLFFAGHI